MSVVEKATEVLAEAIHREDHGAWCTCRGPLRAAIGAVSAAGAEALAEAGLLPTDQRQWWECDKHEIKYLASSTGCPMCANNATLERLLDQAMAESTAKPTCADCGAPIAFQRDLSGKPGGGGWHHLEHPADGHEAITIVARRHLDAMADTHEAYTSSKGYHLRCLWCDHFVTRPTKREAREAMQDHYDDVVGPGKAVLR